MSWLNPALIIAVLSFAKELIKYLREKEEDKKKATEKIMEFSKAIKKARVEGDRKDIERMFNDIVS